MSAQWKEISRIPTELVHIGIGSMPLKLGNHWYRQDGSRVLRAPGLGVGLAGTSDQDLIDAAVGAANAIAADPNYCSNVSVNGSAVNTAVHTFKVAWNNNINNGGDMTPDTLLPFNGLFDQQTVDAMTKAIGDLGVGPGVPSACVASSGGGGGNVTPTPSPTTTTTSQASGATPWIIGGSVAVAAGLVGYAMWRKKSKRMMEAGESSRTNPKRPSMRTHRYKGHIIYSEWGGKSSGYIAWPKGRPGYMINASTRKAAVNKVKGFYS